MPQRMEGEDGKIVDEPEEIRRLWEKYFRKLLNPHDENNDQIVEEENNQWKTNPQNLSWKEMEDAVQKMSSGKAPGPDELSVDMIRGAGPIGLQWLYRILTCVWRNKTVPEAWKKGDTIPLFKKGSKKSCKNYRGITLMSHCAKILERILLNRIGTKIESGQSEEQYGFRPGRSTIDHIFAVRQLMEKSWEFNKKKVMLFIDIEKAYDSVDRQGLWQEMENFGIEKEYIGIIREMYRGYKCRVRTQCGNTEWFEVKNGLKQGSVLSPALFNVVMERMNRQVRERVGERDKKLIFADDMMIWGETVEDVQIQLDAWSDTMKKYGLKISKEKSEVMVFGRDENVDGNIELNGEPLKIVRSFRYLGSEISADGKINEEISKRLQKGGNLYQAIKHMVWDRKIPEKAKILMYKMYYVPIVLYGAEAWTMTEREWSRLQAGEMKFLRAIKGKTRRDRIRNEDIRRELNMESMKEKVEKMRLRWFGHVKRMGEDRLPRRMEEMRMEGRRPRGRPRWRWIDGVVDGMLRRGCRWQQVEEERWWEDRGRWRGIVNTQTRH